MTIKVKDSDVKYLKDLCRYFNVMTASVQEVHITVDPFTGVEVHEAADALVKFRDQCILPETIEMLSGILDQIEDFVPDTDNLPLRQFYNAFDKAHCTCSSSLVTAYDLDQHCGDAPVKGFFEAWDSMVQSIKDNSRDSVLYYGHKLHSLINSMDTSIYDYRHGTWVDDYINWYLDYIKEETNGADDN